MADPDEQTDAAAPRRAERVAAIDIGSNSIRLVVAEALAADRYRLLTDEKEVARLARGRAEDGTLDDERMGLAVDAVERMVRIASGYGAGRVKLVATAAVREAPNRDAFVDLLRARTGLDVEVISGDAEARLAHDSVAHEFDVSSIRAAVVDIGGASTELVLSAGGLVEHVTSAPVGAVRLTETFGSCDERDPEGFDRMQHHVRDALRDTLARPDLPPQSVFGTGGTFTALGGIAIGRTVTPQREPPSPVLPYSVRGMEMQRSAVRHVLAWLRSLTPERRRSVSGLSEERSDIIIAGLTIVEESLRRLGANSVIIHDQGVRDGIVLGMLRELFATTQSGLLRRDRMSGVLEFGRRCHFEERHSQHVAMLALSIFDQLVELLGDDPDADVATWAAAGNRDLLRTAALLRDVGAFVNYNGHHKHSFHLIVHSDLTGFSPRELQVVANIARYHRKAEPKRRHEWFAQLQPEDQVAVRWLAAILRVADGLDRTQSQSVTEVVLALDDDALHLHVHAHDDPDPELFGAKRKSGLLATLLGRRVEFARAATVASAEEGRDAWTP